jgi:hypothetical protein
MTLKRIKISQKCNDFLRVTVKSRSWRDFVLIICDIIHSLLDHSPGLVCDGLNAHPKNGHQSFLNSM